ncbi:hypothetical protein CIPAW_12G020100 [Carya illinoinensis]|uniref:Uncharacterized protein n=1 Tax=Carya illinoinensis TaxID=32201 RepID=A0A8T1NVT3_CARIL|nr:hypothetical protein CIPAW_12G020100 [Carya illinoinensis]
MKRQKRIISSHAGLFIGQSSTFNFSTRLMRCSFSLHKIKSYPKNTDPVEVERGKCQTRSKQSTIPLRTGWKFRCKKTCSLHNAICSFSNDQSKDFQKNKSSENIYKSENKKKGEVLNVPHQQPLNQPIHETKL